MLLVSGRWWCGLDGIWCCVGVGVGVDGGDGVAAAAVGVMK